MWHSWSFPASTTVIRSSIHLVLLLEETLPDYRGSLDMNQEDSRRRNFEHICLQEHELSKLCENIRESIMLPTGQMTGMDSNFILI